MIDEGYSSEKAAEAFDEMRELNKKRGSNGERHR